MPQTDMSYTSKFVLNPTFFFLKLGIRSKNRLIRRDQSHRPLAGFKPHLLL